MNNIHHSSQPKRAALVFFSFSTSAMLSTLAIALFTYDFTDAEFSSENLLNNASSCIPRYEIASLQDLFVSTKGDDWTWRPSSFGEHWNFSDPNVDPCIQHWQGIQCSLSDVNLTQHIMGIHLESYNLIGTLPESMSNLTQLSVLLMRKNSISGSLPVSLAMSKHLHWLDLQGNHINGTIPAQYGNLTSLRGLHLSMNKLHGSIPSTLGQLTNLTLLDLGVNKLTGVLPESLSQLSRLEHFLVMFNRLSGTIPASYGSGLSALRTFNTYNNTLHGYLPTTLCMLYNLSMITVAVNMFSGPVPACLPQLTNLTYIDLFDNRFTGSIPASFKNFPQLQILYLNRNYLYGDMSILCNVVTLAQFYVEYNDFTGTIPPCLAALPLLTDLFLHHNYLTGTIPAVVGNARNMKYIDLDSNLLTGTIPISLGSLHHLTFLFLFNNHLSGVIPASLSQLQNLTLLLLQNNHLTGPLEHVFNASLQTKLNTVQLSGNAFTGTIPEQPFLIPSLRTFSLVDNCMHGSIPSVICSAQGLTALTLDGLGTAKACRKWLLPGLSNSYTASDNSVRGGRSGSSNDDTGGGTGTTGGVPGCLLSQQCMPNLTTLHLSGNRLNGKLPIFSTSNESNASTKESSPIGNATLNSGVCAGNSSGSSDIYTLSNSLLDLTLSHNLLTGSVPVQIQQRQWYHLDLSFNRLNGVLRSDFSTVATHVIKNQDNAVFEYLLSDATADSQLSLQNNRFSGDIPASIQRLPNVTVLTGNMFTCDLQRQELPANDEGSDSYQCGSNSFDAEYYTWLSVLCFTFVVGAVLYRSRDAYTMCSRVKGYVCKWYYAAELPELQAKLKNFKYVFANAEVIGRTAFGCTCYIIIVLLPLYAGCTSAYSTITYQYAWTVAITYMSGDTPFILCFIFVLLLNVVVLLLFKRSRELLIKLENGNEDEEDDLNEVRTADQSATTQQIYGAYASFFITNFIVVCGVNVLFVYIVLYQSNQTQEAAQIALSLFKGFWNSTGTLYLMQYSFKAIAGGDTAGADFINTHLFVALFNNIAIPCLVVAVVSADCFYDVFVAPPNVQSAFMYLECAIFANDRCFVYYPVLDHTTYAPPFTYSYQCGAQFITSYAPAFVYLGLEVAFLAPLWSVLLQYLHARATKGTYCYSLVDYYTPKILKQLDPSLLKKVEKDPFSSFFHAPHLCVQLMTYFGIILTFGTVFPPLAVVMMVAIFSLLFTNKLILGRFITNAMETNAPQYITAVEQDAQGVGGLHVNKLRIAAWMVLGFACSFYTIFFFDMLGDRRGFYASYWVFIALPLVPVGIYLVYKLSRKKGRVSLWRRLTALFRGNQPIVVVIDREGTQQHGVELAPLDSEKGGERGRQHEDTANPLNGNINYESNKYDGEVVDDV